MIVIKNKYIPFGSFLAINICGVVFTKDELTDEQLNHEYIHSKQMLEMLIIGFYLWYIVEFVIKWIKYKSFIDAYKNLSFEREAYVNKPDFTYSFKRKSFSWFKYLTIKN